MKKINISYCIIGHGYTAKVASALLSRKHKEILVIGPEKNTPIFEMPLARGSISPLPIFPPRNCQLTKRLDMERNTPAECLAVKFFDQEEYTPNENSVMKNSFAEFLINTKSNSLSFILSLKQWGNDIFERPFTEVQKKVNRHYKSGADNTRIGFFRGFTPYYHVIRKSEHPELKIKQLKHIDILNRIIYADDYAIHYGNLLSTIPYPSLLKYCRIKVPDKFSFTGARFYYFSHDGDFAANQIIYDCHLDSPIFRIFSPTGSHLIVQTASMLSDTVSSIELKKSIEKIIPTIRGLIYEGKKYFRLSYPTESISKDSKSETFELLRQNSIIPFGRFGNWEYKDLHELDWEMI